MPKAKQKYLVDRNRWTGVYGYDVKRTANGKPDVSYTIAYRVDSKLIWEKVGLRSEGYTPQMASEIRADRMRLARHGGTVKTAKEIRREKARKNRAVAEVGKVYFDERGAELRGYKTDYSRFKKYVEPTFGAKTVEDLCPLDIERFRRKNRKLAPATISNILELLRRTIRYGNKIGICPRLSFTVEMPRKDNEVVEYLTPVESNRLLTVIDSWDYPVPARMLKLAMFTGMRRGEIFKLRTNDLDFNLSMITIRSPKGGKTSTIPMNKFARVVLLDQLEWRNEKYPDSEYVFPGKKGGRRVDCSTVDRIKKAAGLPKSFRIFHGLRHHFAVTLANSGEVSLEMIQTLLTHKSAAMTRRYGQFLPETVLNASEKGGEVLMKQAEKGKKAKVIPMRGKAG